VSLPSILSISASADTTGYCFVLKVLFTTMFYVPFMNIKKLFTMYQKHKSDESVEGGKEKRSNTQWKVK
jgi:hypothetical protein